MQTLTQPVDVYFSWSGQRLSYPIELNLPNAKLGATGDYGYHYLDFSQGF